MSDGTKNVPTSTTAPVPTGAPTPTTPTEPEHSDIDMEIVTYVGLRKSGFNIVANVTTTEDNRYTTTKSFIPKGEIDLLSDDSEVQAANANRDAERFLNQHTSKAVLAGQSRAQPKHKVEAWLKAIGFDEPLTFVTPDQRAANADRARNAAARAPLPPTGTRVSTRTTVAQHPALSDVN